MLWLVQRHRPRATGPPQPNGHAVIDVQVRDSCPRCGKYTLHPDTWECENVTCESQPQPNGHAVTDTERLTSTLNCLEGIRWVPQRSVRGLSADGTWWRVYRGQRQLGHVASMDRGRWLASHIEPGSQRRLERPFATLREAARFAIGGTV